MKHTRRQFLTGLTMGALMAGLGQGAPLVKEETDFDASTQARLNAALDQVAGQVKAPGLIVGVWVEGKSWTAVRGLANTSTREPATLNLHTRIGSITKTITGTLILQLVDEGQLQLDDTIEPWFPELPDANKITIRMLGSMSSGIASYTQDKKTVDEYFAHPEKIWTPAELVAAGTGLARMFAPGKGFFYSNTNFVMLGMIVERLRGKPLPEVFQQQIFAGLGMAQSSYPMNNALPEASWSGYTLQGSKGGQILDATGWSPTFASAAGEVVSTLHDLRLWTRALGTGSLLRPSTQAERLKPNSASAVGGREYCFAVGIEHGWLAHEGELPGYNSQIAYLPSQDASIVVLTNSDIPSANGKTPAAQVLDALTRVVSPENAT